MELLIAFSTMGFQLALCLFCYIQKTGQERQPSHIATAMGKIKASVSS